MKNKIYKIALLNNEHLNTSRQWVASLNKNESISFDIIDLTSKDWLLECSSKSYDLFIANPSGTTSIFKQLYDERILILSKYSITPIYPSVDEILIYENKRYLSYFLTINKIPHPLTKVFYNKDEAIAFSQETDYPVVAKINIGAAGNGVNIFDTSKEVQKYITAAFSSSGVGAKVGPKLKKGNLFKRLLKAITNPQFVKSRLSLYKSISEDKQRGFVIFQKYIRHDFEWRCVRIGESFFAHKKLIKDNKASGSLEKGYENPPLKLMNFIREISEEHGLTSVAIDVFENPTGEGYLVNEIQTIFGQSDNYQMEVDGKIGRYIYNNGWQFEEGDFNTNESYDLRLEHALTLLKKIV